MEQWFGRSAWVLEWLGIVSLVSFVATLALVPIAIVQLPPDYFVRHKRDPLRRRRSHPLVYGIGIVLKNLLGVVLIAAGIVMLVLPGQGLLTILIGLMLTNFPGKFHLEQAMIRNPHIASAINTIRARAGKPALMIPDEDV